ncbi:MAG: Ig-like domain-containing domain, partial [Bacteroidota bacterium]
MLSRHCTLPYKLGMLAALTFLLYACAEVIPPEGGPKDTKLPKLIKTLPAHESTNFHKKTLTLFFDKAIRVQDLNSKLVVTPKLKKLEGQPSYTYKVRGKKLLLTLVAPLEEATTYTFNFNDAVRDLTEGNIAKDVVLTFSTGDQLDQMSIAGQIRHLMTEQPIPGALVSLYKLEDDQQNILNAPPDYFAYADKEGRFQLDHLKQGQYHIYASNNKKNQLIADPGTDAYGFLPVPIDLSSQPIQQLTLRIVPADIRPFKLIGQQPQDQYFELSFNKPVKHYTLTWARPLKRFKDAPRLYSHLIEDKKVIQVYNTLGFLEEDSLEAHLKATDLLGNIIEETVEVRFREGSNKKQSSTYQLTPVTNAAIKPAFVGTMTLNKPAREVEADSIYFVVNGQDTIYFHTSDVQFNAQCDVVDAVCFDFSSRFVQCHGAYKGRLNG